MRIRPYRTSDRAAVADICVRTADAGGDSRHVHPDLDLMPNIFALPYAHLEPSLAFVADDGERAVGYVLGTANTPAFVREYRRSWLPGLVDRYPAPSGEPTTPTEVMIGLMHDPERMIVPELADYPAHLHIDLLPEHQRGGHGRALMGAFVDALARAGVPAVHLGMLTVNTGARAFYDRLGFHTIAVPAHADLTYLGLEVGPNARLGTSSAG
ncbi:GNAT family N-acetyltransferase [Umezawaea sp. Da 62-37]|uniref:GNAT family N-acetyltransferase n=1 Tax=Umezawaea sp. Da 62-37 TaxID=3075927 RepID=UPI0028F6E69B|nr:GNAT family N-acetyltransferase [Umezawaea sp. Da 62-37]WNV89500.1 GNAT family N-acetyltransferase [Umezawaea sp. Da 62-37]